MALFGGSKSSTVSTTTTTTDVDSYNLADVDGPVVAGSERVEITTNIQTVDAGLVDAAIESFGASRAISSGAFDVTREAIRANQDTIAEAFEFGGDALRGMQNVSYASLDFGRDVVDTSIDALRAGQQDAFGFVRDLFSESLNAVTLSGRQAQDTLSSAITKAADATRSDATNVLNNIVKYGAIVVAAAVIAYGLRNA